MSNVSHGKYATASWQGNYDTFKCGPEDGIRYVGFTLDIGTDNLGAGDVWKFVRLDSDTVVLGATLIVDDLDSDGSAAVTIDLGYDLDSGTDDDDYFLANSTIGQAGGSATSAAAPLFATADYVVQAKVETAAATAQAGTATCYLTLANKNAQ
jgi:hypothetical protein